MTVQPSKFRQAVFDDARKQAADVVLESSIDFLLRNGISKERILESVITHLKGKGHRKSKPQFKLVSAAYEEMGTVLSTWFDCPDFLTPEGNPVALSVGRGPASLARLLRTARVHLDSRNAIELLQQSPSVRFNADGSISALRRVFVLANFNLCRAALVLPRYIDTLSSNSDAYKSGTVKLLERQCSVSRINLRSIAPILRSIKNQGASFVDSVDSQIERRKTKLPGKRADSELGLLVFAWTKTKVRKS